MNTLKPFYILIFSVLVFTGNFALADEQCAHYKSFINSGINPKALNQALNFSKKNSLKYKLKSDYLLIADYSLNSSQKRFFIFDLINGQVIKERVSHGSGKITLYKPAATTEKQMYVERFNGETSHNGHFKNCRISKPSLERINKNRFQYNRGPKHNQENLTRAGFFKTAELYISASHKKENRPEGRHHWFPLAVSEHNGVRLDGLSPFVNELSRAQGVVMHEATYNTKHAPIMGRSYGCPAFERGALKRHLNKIKGGRLYYSFVPQCAGEMLEVLKQTSSENPCN